MMTRPSFRLAACALALGLAFAGPALAQSKKELVAKVIQLQQGSIDAIARNMAGQTAQQVLQVAAQAMSQVPAEKREAIGKDLQAEIKRFHEELEPLLRTRAAKLAPAAMSPVLEEKFSEDELKQLIAWLESATARKFNQVGPDMLAALQQQLVTDTRPTVEPKLRTLEENLRKKLGQAAAPASAPASAAAPAKASKTK